MKQIILTAVIAAASIFGASAQNDSNGAAVEHKAKFEFRPYWAGNYGLTTSLGIPAETREIKSSKWKYNYVFGCDVNLMLSQKWGIGSGLRYERKAGNSCVVMKNFLTTITLAGEGTPTYGYFSGTVDNTFDNRYVTLPLTAIYRASKKWDIRWGMYFAYNVSPSYTGIAYDGKIRENPLVPAVGVDNSTSDFSDDVNRFDAGIQVGGICAIWKGLTINLDIDWGLVNVLDAPQSGMTMKVYNLYFSCGLGWRF